MRTLLKNDPTKHFFYLEFPGLKTAKGRQKNRFYCEIVENQSKFDLQFGRVMACHLLNQQERINWKNCTLDKEKEEQLALMFKGDLEASKKKKILNE